MKRALLTVALIVSGAAGACAQSRSLLDLLGVGNGAWQGTWGIAGETPVVTVAGSAISYVGSDQQPFAVSAVAITSSTVTFQVGSATIALTRQSDNAVAMVSTMSGHRSDPILLCRPDAPRCP